MTISSACFYARITFNTPCQTSGDLLTNKQDEHDGHGSHPQYMDGYRGQGAILRVERGDTV